MVPLGYTAMKKHEIYGRGDFNFYWKDCEITRNSHTSYSLSLESRQKGPLA